MDNTCPNPESSKHQQFKTKTALLRLTVILLALLVTHMLLLWLHPLGAHDFFANLFFGAFCFWAVIRIVMPRFKDTPAEIDRRVANASTVWAGQAQSHDRPPT
jgi:hypothetical protein